MKYQLINNQTKEKHLCDKVTVDGFDYYVSEDKPKENDWCIKEQQYYGKSLNKAISYSDLNSTTAIWKKIIATNNPNLDIPQVVDEVERLAWEHTDKKYIDIDVDSPKAKLDIWNANYFGFQEGYHKSQETHPFSEENIIDFAEWVDNMGYRQVANGLYKSINDEKGKLTKELLQLWKEQKPKIVYYEN